MDEFDISPNQSVFNNNSSWDDQVVNIDDKTNENSEPEKKKRTLLFYVFIGLAVFMFLIVLMVIVLKFQKNEIKDLLPTYSTTPRVVMSELEEKIYNLDAELKNADPIKSELPFPPVKMNLFLPSPSPKL